MMKVRNKSMKQIRLPRWGKAILIIALVILLAAALAKPAEKGSNSSYDCNQQKLQEVRVH